MKKRLLLLSVLCSFLNGIQAQNKWANQVLEFLPAPGQFTNEKAYPSYSTGDDAATMATKATDIIVGNMLGTSNNLSTISLGAYGGYIVVGFDHPVMNKPYAYDLKIHGNWFDGNAESGIVMVSEDVNNNGLADDPWFELAGSEYYNPETIHNYEIRYEKPNPVNGNVHWTDNQGEEGYVLRNTYHLQESYYPLWYRGETLIFKGTKMQSNAWNTALPPQEYWRSESFAWGYADNYGNATELSNFDISWAVDVNGNSVNLEKIDFVKVYTALIQDAGWLGETSTEFSQAEDLHPEYVFPPVFNSDVHIVDQLPSLTQDSYWQGNSITSFTDGVVTFRAEFDGIELKNGFTYSNQAMGSYASVSNDFTEGNPFIIGRYDALANENSLMTFNDGLPHGLEGVYVNNSLVALETSFSLLQKNDQVKLVAKGLDEYGNYTGHSAAFLLADYTQTNSVMNYVVEEWCWMDLSAIGSAYSVEFSLEANRSEIIPSSFCLYKPVIDILSITKQPIGNPNGNPKLCSGAEYTLSTDAGGENLSFQWFKNGEIITGATEKEIHFAAVEKTHSGNYYCVISNGTNMARTEEVPLVIFQTTKINQNLPSDTVDVLQTEVAMVAIEVEGENLDFLWYKGNPKFPNNPYQIVSFALNSTAKSPNLVPAEHGFVSANDGMYYVRVTGSCNTLVSDTAYYRTIPNPTLQPLTIHKQPKDTIVCYGNAAYMALEANAATSFTWQRANPIGNFFTIPNSQSSGFGNPQIEVYNQLTDTDYRCMVKQDATTLYSDTVTVRVVQKLAFTKPANLVNNGSYSTIHHQPLEMMVSAIDFTPTAYQWYYKSNSDTEFTKLVNETDSTYKLEYVLLADAGKYRCVVEGELGTSMIEYTLNVSTSFKKTPVLYVYTNTHALSGLARPTGLFEIGEKAVINTQVQNGFSFTWYKDGEVVIVPAENQSLGNDESVVSGYWTRPTTASAYLIIKNITEEYAGEYVLQVEGPNGMLETSEPINIIINPEKPLILNALSDTTLTEDETVSFSIEADTKGLQPQYQWYHNNKAVMGGTKSPFVLTGADKKKYSFQVKPTTAGAYHCVVTTPGGSDTSNVVTVTVNPKVKITGHPTSQIVVDGNSASFKIVAAGENLNYQWLKNGEPIVGATGEELIITEATFTDEAAYSCVVTSEGFADAESGSAELAVIEKPIVEGNAICLGEKETILHVQNEVKPILVRYQWYKNQQTITGATYSWINIKNADLDENTYYCVVTNGENIQSELVELVRNVPEITINLPKIVDAIEDEAFSLAVETNNMVSYQWYKNATPMNGQEGSGLAFVSNETEEGDYHVVLTNLCGSISSDTAMIQIDEITSVVTDYESQRVATVFPNPTSGQLYLNIIDADKNYSFSVMSINGVEVKYQTVLGKTMIDLSDLSQGLYLIKLLEDEEVKATYRIVKE